MEALIWDISFPRGKKFLGSVRRRLVPPTGIEPATQGLGIPCSIRLSYGGT